MLEMAEAELCFPHLNTSCRKPQIDTSEDHLTYGLICFLSSLTVALNLLVIISIAHFRYLQTPTNLILLSLAVSDFLVGIAVIPVMGNIWKSCWYFGDFLCSLAYLVPCSAVFASIGNVVLISVDRYVAICDPLHYPIRMNEKVVTIIISVCWIYAFLHGMSTSLDNFINQDKYRLCHGACIIHASIDINFILDFVIPVSIIFFLYIRIFVKAVSQARAMCTNVTATSKTSKKSEIKAARNLSIVVLVYIMCYSPYYFVVYFKANITILGMNIELVMIYVVFVNSCINPLIYALLYPWFRKAIKLIITLQITKHGSSDLKIL